jgi:hypothetical protein
MLPQKANNRCHYNQQRLRPDCNGVVLEDAEEMQHRKNNGLNIVYVRHSVATPKLLRALV